MCSSQKYLYPPKDRSLEIPRGRGWRGDEKVKIVTECTKFNSKFLEGEGSNQNTFCVDIMDIFWNHTMI